MNKNELSELLELAEDGDCTAQNVLGVKFAQSNECQSQRDALYWYLEAVENGYVESMWNAGTMLLNGEGGIKNQELGLHLIKIAAESGNNSACLYLSDCYDSGAEGVEKNTKLAEWWREAAWDISNEQDLAEFVNVDDYLTQRPEKPK